MFLTKIKLTPTTYTATVDGFEYNIDVTGFPADKAVALAIEEIRKLVNAGAPQSVPAPSDASRPVEPAKPRQRRAKIDTPEKGDAPA